jgi:hypothetical protein
VINDKLVIGSAMRNQSNGICLALLLAECMLLPKIAAGQSDAMQRVPDVIEECETIASKINCATRRLKGDTFDARWQDGSIGHIKMEQNSGKVAFEREDNSGASSGLTVTYYGTLHSDRITNGTFARWRAGRATQGTWTATFVCRSNADH